MASLLEAHSDVDPADVTDGIGVSVAPRTRLPGDSDDDDDARPRGIFGLTV